MIDLLCQYVCVCVLVFTTLFTTYFLLYLTKFKIISDWPLLPLDSTCIAKLSSDNSNKLGLVQLTYKYKHQTKNTTWINLAPVLPGEGRCQTLQLWNCVYRQDNPRGGWQLQKSNWFHLTQLSVGSKPCGLHNDRPLSFWSKMSPEGVESVKVTAG